MIMGAFHLLRRIWENQGVLEVYYVQQKVQAPRTEVLYLIRLFYWVGFPLI